VDEKICSMSANLLSYYDERSSRAVAALRRGTRMNTAKDWSDCKAFFNYGDTKEV